MRPMDYNNDNQNNQNNQWDRWDSNASNSSYYNQPTHRPYRQGFMLASGICGILSITTCCTGIFSLPLGALGILFAVLASRKGKKLNATCITGIVTSIIGIIAGIAMIVTSFMMLPELMQNELYKEQLDIVTEQMYGMDFSEFLEEYYGYSMEE